MSLVLGDICDERSFSLLMWYTAQITNCRVELAGAGKEESEGFDKSGCGRLLGLVVSIPVTHTRICTCTSTSTYININRNFWLLIQTIRMVIINHIEGVAILSSMEQQLLILTDELIESIIFQYGTLRKLNLSNNGRFYRWIHWSGKLSDSKAYILILHCLYFRSSWHIKNI